MTQGRRRRVDNIPEGQPAIVGMNIRTLRQRKGCSQAKLGELMGWRSTLHTLYRDYAEDIVNRVIARTRLTVPDGVFPSGAAHAY